MTDSMAATETSVGGRVIVFAQSIFLQSVALCVNPVWGLDCKYSDWKQSSCITSLLRTREKSVFTWCLCLKDDACWLICQAINSPVCMEITQSVHTHTHTLATSLFITIEIVIDLSYLSPVAIRSHLLSGPYWKGKHSWCYRLNECPALGCSADAVRLALSSMMDGANSGYTFTTTSQLLNSGWM